MYPEGWLGPRKDSCASLTNQNTPHFTDQGSNIAKTGNLTHTCSVVI